MTAATKIWLDETNLDWIPSTRGIDVQNFELAMGRYLNADKCIAVNSGTSALFLALKACGIGKGDRVLVPATTFIATANAVSYTGAKVVLCDVDRKGWCYSAPTITKRHKIKAIIPVMLYGNFSMPIERPSPDVVLIADSAESIEGLSWNAFLDFFCYSFNGNKNMTTGGGGLVATTRQRQHDKADKIRRMINPGHCREIGYNYGMTALSARLGLEQLPLLDEHKKKKERFNQIYRENLKHRLTFQQVAGTPWMTAVLFPKGTHIPGIQRRLESMGIPTRRVFEPLNHHPCYRDGKTYPVAEDIWSRGLCLPSSVRNSEEEIYEVCQKIKALL
jgi:perosamine synthetase